MGRMISAAMSHLKAALVTRLSINANITVRAIRTPQPQRAIIARTRFTVIILNPQQSPVIITHKRGK